MTVHVIIPVHNRLAMTQQVVACLRRQSGAPPLRMLVVDDGSSDGSGAWLAAQDDIEVLNGDGSLFWGGAVDLAMRRLFTMAAAADWVLLLNNDVAVGADYVQQLLAAAGRHAPAAIGSVFFDGAEPARQLSTGTRIDAWRLATRDVLADAGRPTTTDVEVDVLSGRGALYPVAALIASGGMRPRLLPHHLADFELSLRVRKAGWRLLAASAARVFSSDSLAAPQPSPQPSRSRHEDLFSIRSGNYMPAQLAFWWQAGNWRQRLILPLSYPLLYFIPGLRKLLK